jgi:drug/metabolite transporter (DMT)-like permease
MTVAVDARRHALAVGGLVLATLMWSVAGAVTRHLDAPTGPAITLWRSVFAGLAVLVYLVWVAMKHKRLPLVFSAPTLFSGAMWCAMFCCFMFALARTSVANTLVVYSLAPLLTAVLAALVLGTRILRRTWVAIVLVTTGLVCMFARDFNLDAMGGVWIALGVPLASALNLVAMKKAGASVEFVPALLIGCALSIAVTAPFAWPLTPSLHDLGLLAFLGVFQLGLPCILMLRVVPYLSAPETSLLDLLEIVFGVLWAWLGAGEIPSLATLVGGSVVLFGLALHELAAFWTPVEA